MKKTRLFVFAALIAAAFASCQKEENFEPQQQPEAPEVATVPFEISAYTENSQTPTRLSLGKDFKPAWEEGDQLGVYDGVKIQQFDLTNLETSTFTGSLAEGATLLNAIYPYGAATAFSDGKFTASIPAEQVIEQGDSLATDALLAMAQPVEIGEGQVQFAFKNVCGLIRFEISKAGQVKEFIISGNKSEKFAGEGVIGFETRTENEVEKQVPVFTPSENAATVVRVRPAGENATFEKGTYYAAVAPVTFAEGFSVTLLTVNDAATVSKGTEKEMVIPRNSGMGLQDLINIAEWDWKIYTVEQLLAWNAAPTSPNHRVQLMADLDMEGVKWTPKTFQGVFEGNNHKIYNFTINRNGHCGFVEYMNKDAVIRNLILGSKDGETYDGVSKFTYTPGEEVGSWVHVGSVAAKVDGNSLLENVTNFINLETPDSEGTAKVCMGGITSMGSSKETISNCVNYGNVTCNASKGAVTGASNHQLGGIISKTDGSTQVIGCKNYGAITAGGAYVDNIGGIIANPNGNSTDKGENKPLIKDCYNYGNIVVTKAVSDAKATPMALGGIVGKLTGATVENCHNQGNISSVCDVLTAMGGVVGAHALSFESKIIACSNGVQGNSEKGILTFAPEAATQQMVLGGILGRHHSPKDDKNAPGKLTVQNCNNYAPIATSYIKMRNVGGVVGAIALDDVTIAATNVEMLIDQCHNHGAITIGGTGSYGDQQRHIGGIVGVVCGSDNAVTISNCTNNAVISTTATNGGEHRMSGIVGYAYSGTILVSKCTNNGEVKATGTAKNPRPAGIASVIDGTGITISGCYNKAKISTASSTGNVYIGGIVAYSVKTTITDCHNEGQVEVTKTGGQIRMGGVAGQQTTSGKVLQCTNSAKVYCAVANTHSAESQVGGVIGYLEKSQVSNCTNTADAEVAVAGISFKPRVGGVIGCLSGGGTSTFTDNINEGTVTSATTTPANGNNVYIGGVAGWSTKVTIERCQNKGTVNGADTKTVPYVGGVLGVPSADVIVKNCRNAESGKVESTAAAGTTYIGGVLSKGVSTTKVQNCYNDGLVRFKQNANHCFAGGIVGYGLGLIENCENTSTGLVAVEHTAANGKYALAGGIVGSIRESTTVNSCTNNGTVKALVNTNNNLTGAGGILGQPRKLTTLKNNVNNGYVYAENKHTSGGKAYAGGIFATDVENDDATYTGAVSITGNKNYGKVEVKSTKSAANTVDTTMPGVAAGGLFGLIGRTPAANVAVDNVNYGEVVATEGDSNVSAGALAGASNIEAWSSQVGKNVKVNGVLWNAWAEGAEAAWLCPSATNPLTATYVDAPAAQ